MLQRAMHDLEETLRCSICRELFHIPVTVQPCCHSFCSECIRKCLTDYHKNRFHHKTCCPICRTPLSTGNHQHPHHKKRTSSGSGSSGYTTSTIIGATLDTVLTKGLVANHTLDDKVQQYKHVRHLLRKILLREDKDDDVALLTRTTTTTCQGATEAEPEMETDSTAQIDAILAAARTATIRTTTTTTRTDLKRRRRVMYNHYKKHKELQDLCRQEGLSTHGTDAQLRQRHADFCLKINAECDARYPRTLEQVLNDFNSQEHAKQQEQQQQEWNNDYRRMMMMKGGSSSSGSGDMTMTTTTTRQQLQTLYETRRQVGINHNDNNNDNNKTTTTWSRGTSNVQPTTTGPRPKKTKVTTGNCELDATMERNFAQMIQELRARKQKQLLEQKLQEQEKQQVTDSPPAPVPKIVATAATEPMEEEEKAKCETAMEEEAKCEMASGGGETFDDQKDNKHNCVSYPIQEDTEERSTTTDTIPCNNMMKSPERQLQFTPLKQDLLTGLPQAQRTVLDQNNINNTVEEEDEVSTRRQQDKKYQRRNSLHNQTLLTPSPSRRTEGGVPETQRSNPVTISSQKKTIRPCVVPQ